MNCFESLFIVLNKVFMDFDKSKMTVSELFFFYLDQPDKYKDILYMAHLEIGDKLFPMLEECERTGKVIRLKEEMKNVIDPPMTVLMVKQRKRIP